MSYYTVHHKGLITNYTHDIPFSLPNFGLTIQQVVNPEGLYLCAQDISIRTLTRLQPLIYISIKDSNLTVTPLNSFYFGNIPAWMRVYIVDGKLIPEDIAV